MNFETKLDPRLWEAIRKNIELRSFTPAILEACYLLSDVIRDRSGIEGDGVALVGAAFGGSAPKLRINRLQTDSEKDIQKGVEALLRGMYQAIRNPRSHGPTQSSEDEAYAIILFMNYLLGIIDGARAPFSLPSSVARILDTEFVPKKEYATLLVNNIPNKHLLEVCLEVMKEREHSETANLKIFFSCALEEMNEQDRAQFFDVISEELEVSSYDGILYFVLKTFDGKVWKELRPAARMRSEHRIIRAVREGRYSSYEGRCTDGHLGTHALVVAEFFELKTDLWKEVGRKLIPEPNGYDELDYVLQYFVSEAPSILPSPPPLWVPRIKTGLRRGDTRIKNCVDQWGLTDFDSKGPVYNEEDPWRKPFLAEIQAFKSADPT